MLASASGRVEDALGAEFGLQAGGELEDAALAFDLGERVFAAGVGHVFAVDDDARIAAHLVVQAGVDQVGHGLRRACPGPLRFAGAGAGFGGLLRSQRSGWWGRVLGVDVARDAVERRQRRGQRGFGGLGNFAVDLLLELVDLLGGEDALAQQAHLHAAMGSRMASASRSAAER